ncbi:hypothetical protein GGR23_003385, partial [Gellertiella hungarica]|nr:hypothetical protein [Gellertiella hungarica]
MAGPGRQSGGIRVACRAGKGRAGGTPVPERER